MKSSTSFFLYLFIFLLFMRPLFSGAELPRIYSEQNENGTIIIYGDNSNLIPVWVQIFPRQQENLTPTGKLPYIMTLSPESQRTKVLSLSPTNPHKHSRFSYSYRSNMGKEPSKVHHSYRDYYFLPFEHGTKHLLSQGYFGASTHHGANPYALDFSLDEATPVHAARGGIVARIKDDSNIGGPDKKYDDDANYVEIYHNDGTFALYVHLMQNGATVRLGDEVLAGQLIGYSGNTGHSSGPHLHFEVYKKTMKGNKKNFPVTFLDYEGHPFSNFTEGETYYSRHRGKEEFTPILGSLLTDFDYQNQLNPVRKTEAITFRSEIIDRTMVLFVQNGFQSKCRLKIDMELTNYRSSKKLPVDIELPPLSEKFIALLNQESFKDISTYLLKYEFYFVGRRINDSDETNTVGDIRKNKR